MKKLMFMLAVVLLIAVHSFAQKSEIFEVDGAAINGYDVVAFFKEGKPLKGKADFSYQWKGTNWFFSSKQNLDSFKTTPEKFAPQYGGYCAYGSSDGTGHKAPTEANTWTIVNGKLYFNYNNDVKAMWGKDKENLIKKADTNWPALKDKE